MTNASWANRTKFQPQLLLDLLRESDLGKMLFDKQGHLVRLNQKEQIFDCLQAMGDNIAIERMGEFALALDPLYMDRLISRTVGLLKRENIHAHGVTAESAVDSFTKTVGTYMDAAVKARDASVAVLGA